MREHHDTLIIGAGQAGLAMSNVLRQRGREHVVLERGRVGERWRTERWDSLRFQFPNWTLHLPGYTYGGDDPDGFAHYTEIGRIIEEYARSSEAPVREGTEVLALDELADATGFLATTGAGEIAAQRVVIATGPFQRPFVPRFASDLPASISQIDPTRYRGPADLPPGAVLVVGSGASGCQIADELNRAGRTVYLSVSPHRRVPRRYRGQDLYWWFDKMGRFEVTIDSFPNREWPPSTVVTGVDGGYDVDVRRLAAEGVHVRGRTLGVSDGVVGFAPDANDVLDQADQACASFVAAADALIAHGLDAALTPPDDPPSPLGGLIDSAVPLDLAKAGIGTVIWATGYQYDYGWVRIPVIDPHGRPIQTRGVTDRPGLYFLGLHWMHTFRSGLFSGVGVDAEYLADAIAAESTSKLRPEGADWRP